MNVCGRAGDQNFIERATGLKGATLWQDILPDQFVSYKRHNCEHSLPPGARVMSLHGFPKFTDLAENHWARRAWESAA
jgi:hypothetical protein